MRSLSLSSGGGDRVCIVHSMHRTNVYLILIPDGRIINENIVAAKKHIFFFALPVIPQHFS
jgi:hypothetical protein